MTSAKKKMGRPATGQTPVQGVRVSDERWKKLGDEAERAGTDRSKVINDFAAWYTREPGAKAVRRPDAPAAEQTEDEAPAADE